MAEAQSRVASNKQHYDQRWAAVSIFALVDKVRRLDEFLRDATRTDTSWVAMYHGDFRARLKAASILELGSGDGLNALIMAASGACVVAVDLSQVTARLIAEASAELGLTNRVTAYVGDFCTMPCFQPATFDIVVGKAFLHHLTHEEERECLRRVSVVLRPDGEARFVEPAVNNRALDFVRWLTPVPGRPSRLARRRFAQWKLKDPHPRRDNSSDHFAIEGLTYFDSVDILPFGAIERLHRLLPQGDLNRSFRRICHRAQALLPARVRKSFARAQLVVYRRPRCEVRP